MSKLCKMESKCKLNYVFVRLNFVFISTYTIVYIYLYHTENELAKIGLSCDIKFLLPNKKKLINKNKIKKLFSTFRKILYLGDKKLKIFIFNF